MRIITPDDISADALERYLLFRVNNQAIPEIGERSGDDSGWSPVTWFVTDNVQLVRGTRNVFKVGEVHSIQTFEFRVSASAPPEIRDKLSKASIPILFVVERQFQAQPQQPVEGDDGRAAAASSRTQCV
jgi:hypothetical protein